MLDVCLRVSSQVADWEWWRLLVRLQCMDKLFQCFVGWVGRLLRVAAIETLQGAWLAREGCAVRGRAFLRE